VHRGRHMTSSQALQAVEQACVAAAESSEDVEKQIPKEKEPGVDLSPMTVRSTSGPLQFLVSATTLAQTPGNNNQWYTVITISQSKIQQINIFDNSNDSISQTTCHNKHSVNWL